MPPVDYMAEAKAREDAKLRRAGLNPDGSPIRKPKAGADNGDADGNEDDGDGDEGNDDGNDDGNGNDDGDEGIDEVAELKRQLAALNGRVGPAQRDADEYQRLYAGERQERERETRELNERIAALTAQIEEREEAIDPKTLLSEDEIADIDPRVIGVVMKLASGIAKKMAPKVNTRAETLSVLAERDAQRVTEYRSQVLTDPARGLHQLGTLAYDPKFIAWSQGEDNDMDSVMHSLLNAKSTGEIDRYARLVAKRITRYKESTKNGSRPTDPNRSLSNHMNRRPGARMTKAESDERLRQAKALARSSNPADRAEAKKLLDSLT